LASDSLLLITGYDWKEYMAVNSKTALGYTFFAGSTPIPGYYYRLLRAKFFGANNQNDVNDFLSRGEWEPVVPFYISSDPAQLDKNIDKPWMLFLGPLRRVCI